MTEQHRVRVFENGVLRVMYGATRGEGTGEWSKLHTNGLHTAFANRSSNVIKTRKMRRKMSAGNVARIDAVGYLYVCKILDPKPQGNKSGGKLVTGETQY